MPYKDKEQAKAFWRRRNAKPSRKKYMREYAKERMTKPEQRERAYAATRKWQAMPESLDARADYQRGRRAVGKVKAQDLRKKEAIAGRPKPDRCEICGRIPTAKSLHFDHCHQHGHFRGWICNGCNCALGFVNDDVQILRKLIAYLERNRTNTAPQLALSGI
jgi:hypothetical protein